jgi:hypothetical protein
MTGRCTATTACELPRSSTLQAYDDRREGDDAFTNYFLPVTIVPQQVSN